MITVEEAKERAAKRLRAGRAKWAGELAALKADEAELIEINRAEFVISLHPPTEKEMLRNELAAETWARQWRRASENNVVSVQWQTRTWRSIGRQEVPTRLRLETADAIASFVGGTPKQDWERLRRRTLTLAGELGRSDVLARAVRRHSQRLLDYSEDDFLTCLRVVKWLTENPVVGLRPRQLPIRGVDTKWFGKHRRLVEDLYEAATDGANLGVVSSDHLVRLRILDADLAVGGISNFAAPVAELQKLRCRPRVVFILENLESMLAMPPWEGAVAVFGSGYAARVLPQIPWVARTPVIYWGDLDSDGFAILHSLRRHHSEVRSALMDEKTLLTHRDLWVKDPNPNRADLTELTAAEQRTLDLIRSEGDVRLEQERIPWQVALRELSLADAEYLPG